VPATVEGTHAFLEDRDDGEAVPVAGALCRYSKFSIGPGFGRFYGSAAARDCRGRGHRRRPPGHHARPQLGRLEPRPDEPHGTILVITLILLTIQTTLNITGARVMGRVAQFGVYVEVLGTFGIALILLIHGLRTSTSTGSGSS